MALVKDSLKGAILAALQDARTDKTLDDAADQLATAIDTYVRSATVTTVTACPAGTGTGAGALT